MSIPSGSHKQHPQESGDISCHNDEVVKNDNRIK